MRQFIKAHFDVGNLERWALGQLDSMFSYVGKDGTTKFPRVKVAQLCIENVGKVHSDFKNRHIGALWMNCGDMIPGCRPRFRSRSREEKLPARRHLKVALLQ